MKHLKPLFFLVVFLASFFNPCVADEASINMHYKGNHGTHSEYYPPADMPEVHYDDNLEQIIIVGDGFADYYDVEIVSLGSLQTVIATQVDGYGDSINVSSLSIGDYRIVITSSNNNVFEGDFAIE